MGVELLKKYKQMEMKGRDEVHLGKGASALAHTKSKTQRWHLEKAVELWASHIVYFCAEF